MVIIISITTACDIYFKTLFSNFLNYFYNYLSYKQKYLDLFYIVLKSLSFNKLVTFTLRCTDYEENHFSNSCLMFSTYHSL